LEILIYIYIYKEPTWCSLAVCLLLTEIILYMFRTLFASIFRSTWFFIYILTYDARRIKHKIWNFSLELCKEKKENKEGRKKGRKEENKEEKKGKKKIKLPTGWIYLSSELE
jgi:hypothetical protein